MTSPLTPTRIVRHETKRESREARYGYCIATQGVPGVDQRTKTETEREQSNGGEFPKTLTPSTSIDITHTLELEHELSLSLAQHFLFETHRAQFNPATHAFLFFSFFAVQHRSFLEPRSQSKYSCD